MPSYILCVRPEPDCSLDAAALDRRNVPAIAGPLMTPHYQDGFDIPNPKDLCGLLFTSRHAVIGMAAAIERRLNEDPLSEDWGNLPVFAVGRATARAAAEAGFGRVFIGIGSGGGAGLVPIIRKHLQPMTAPLFWPAAQDRSYDMIGALAPDFNVIAPAVYAMKRTSRLSDAALDALAYGRILAVVLMSARSASLFCEQLAENGMDHCRPEIAIIAGSEAIAAAAGDGWRRVYAAKRPTRARLLAIASLLYHRRMTLD